MRIVTLEEHIAFPGFEERVNNEQRTARGWANADSNDSPMKRVKHLLEENGSERLASMNANGITLQVLSVTAPGGDVLEAEASIGFAHDCNDELNKKITENPQRFAAFATLPMTAPQAAATELQRAVQELHFCGAMINGTTKDKFLDDAVFEPVLDMAAHLDVPIYLHPNIPPKAVVGAYYSGLKEPLGFQLSMAGFGWHAETAVHILRMVLAGTFDKHPNLKIIIGHMGEMLPMMMARIDNIYRDASLKRAVSEVLKSQVYITTSGIFTQPPFVAALDTFGIDNILFSVDYPYAPNEQGIKFLSDVQLSAEDKEKLAHGNADKLLKLKI